jgi:uncharacterized protein YfaS (alpha-2-macroglobulin family)
MTASTLNAAAGHARAGRPRQPRRRFWLTVAAFAIANIAAWAAFHFYNESRRPAALRVERFSVADGQIVERRPRLTWAFNFPVAPPKEGESVASLSPVVPGKWSWPDPRTLAFTPDADLPKATRFTVNVSTERIRSVDGFRLDKPFSLTFQTAPLALLTARQVGFQDDQPILELKFDDTVIPDEVLRHLTVTGPDGKPLVCLLHGQADGAIVRVRTAALPPTAPDGEGERSVRVALSPGLAGRSGPLGMVEILERSVVVERSLIATEASAYSNGRGEAQVNVAFNNEVDLRSVKQVLSVEPPVKFTASSSYNGVQLRGDFTPGTRYAVKLAAAPAGSDRAKFPRPTSLSVFVPDHQPSVWFENDSGYLGSQGNRTVLAHAVNAFDLVVRVRRLYDNNLDAWRNATDGRSEEPFAEPIAERVIRLPHKKNDKQDVRISLDEILPHGTTAIDGAYRIELVSKSGASSNADYDGEDAFNYRRGRHYGGGGMFASTVVTLSDLGVSAKSGRNSTTAWVTSLSTAKPLANVRVRVFSNKNQPLGEASTGADGLATIPLATPADGESPAVLIADRAGESEASQLTWLDLRDARLNLGGDADTGGRAYLRKGYEAFVYTDRGVYRPGETVHLRAIVRGPDNATPRPFPVTFQIVRPDLKNWRAQTATLDKDGSAGFEIALPADLPTGKWTAKIGLPGTGSAGDKSPAKWFGTATFQVEEFIPDRMKVELSLGNRDRERVSLTGDNATLNVDLQADYLFGRPVSGNPATLVTRVDPVDFRPAGWSGWTFGDAADTAGPLGVGKPFGRRSDQPTAELGAKGHKTWNVNVLDVIGNGEAVEGTPNASPSRRAKNSAPAKTESAPYAGAWRFTATASVLEEGGRAVSATRSIDVDLSAFYVGVRPPQQLVRPAQPSEFAIALLTPDGKPAPTAATDPAQLESTLYRETWNNSLVRDGSSYRYESTRVLEPVDATDAATVRLNDSAHGVCTVTPPDAGSYVLRIHYAETGVVASVAFYAGDGAWDDQISRENPEQLEVVLLPPGGQDAFADAIGKRDVRRLLHLAAAPFSAPPDRFRGGERPRVLVRSPFKGQLLLSVETDSVVSTKIIDMPASQVTVPIDVTDACRPNAYVTATVIRAIDPNAKWRAHRASGVTRLRVDNDDDRLNVAIATPREIRPATSLDAAVRVTDSTGAPVANAAVTVAAVDEGICRLTNFTTPDPFNFFAGVRALAVATADLYGQLMPEVAKPDKTSSPGGDGGDDGEGRYRSPVAAKRVKPVALFSGVVRTGPDGVARVSFSVPQFAGELRLMAVAYHDAQLGSSDARTLVRSPLLVQSSWPRFAAPGDRFTVPIVVFNNATGGGNAAGEAEVRLEVSGGGDGKQPPLKFADADANGRVSRKVSIAPGGQGTTVVDVIALERTGVARVRLVATLGSEQFEETVELPVRAASPTLSRGGYATASPDQPARLEIPSGLLDGTGTLRVNVTPWPDLQLPQGLDYLDRYPYGCAEQTISGLFPLVYLDDVGRRIAPHVFEPDNVKDKVQSGVVRLLGLRTADGGVGMWPGDRSSWSWASIYAAHFVVEARTAGHAIPDDLFDGLLGYARAALAKGGDDAGLLEAQAYACYVLALAGTPDRATMSRLAEVLKSAAARTADDAHAVPTHAQFHLAAAWLAAGRKDLAESLIPKLLPAPRKTREQAGNVGSPVRDRAVMLSTLLAVEPDRPDLPALAQALADEGRSGRWQSTQDTAFAVMAIGRYLKQAAKSEPFDSVELWQAGSRVAGAKSGEPLAWNAGGSPRSSDPLEIRVVGTTKSRAHVSWLQTGVPAQPPADASSGITLRRRYLNERGQPLRNDAVHSGDLVKVELTIRPTTELDNVVIEDLLPAGLEIENPRLLTQAPAAALAKTSKRSNEPATFEPRRIDMRDDRLILMGDLSAGAQTYMYAARAVAPGTFVVPPVRAECMYDIGTSAVAGGGRTLHVVPAGGRGTIADTGND